MPEKIWVHIVCLFSGACELKPFPVVICWVAMSLLTFGMSWVFQRRVAEFHVWWGRGERSWFQTCTSYVKGVFCFRVTEDLLYWLESWFVATLDSSISTSLGG